MFLINKVFFALTIVAALLLLGSYASPHISPQTFWPAAFMGLAYQVLLVINAILCFYWLVQAKLYALIPLAVILAGLSYPGRYYQFSGKEADAHDSTLKIISYNVQNFDERHNGDNQYRDFYAYIKTQQPDIVCMQDFNKWVAITNETTTMDEMKKAFGKPFFYKERNSKTNDLVIFSRYKIIRNKTIFGRFNANNGAMWVDITVGKDTVRVFNVHFQSFLISNVNLDSLDNKSKAIESSKNIIRRLKNGFIKRVPQVDSVLAEMERTPYKIILCGDFNDTPMSYTYSRITNRLDDSFVESGSGVGSTYTGPYPSFRIDYIMHGPGMKAYDYQRGKNYGSDHRLIQAEIALN